MCSDSSGSLYVSVADTCSITCKKTGIKGMLNYVEEGWLDKSQNKVIGVVYKYDVDKDTYTKVRDVPDKDVIGRIDGSWTDKVWFSKGSAAFDRAAVSFISMTFSHGDHQILTNTRMLTRSCSLTSTRYSRYPNQFRQRRTNYLMSHASTGQMSHRLLSARSMARRHRRNRRLKNVNDKRPQTERPAMSSGSLDFSPTLPLRRVVQC